MRSRPYHVLIAENDPICRGTYERYLSDDPAHQFEVTVSDPGDSAEFLCDGRMPDCLVLDRETFELAGPRLHTRETSVESGTTAIVLLDEVNHAIIDRLAAQGAGDWLAKDCINPYRLRQTVRHAVDRSRLERELATCRTALQRKVQAYDEFASIVSHDLSAPARRIDGFCQLLARRYTDKLGAEGEELITFLRDESARLLKLIGDLLTYSRLSSRHQPAQPTDSNAVFNAVLADAEATLRKTGGHVTFDSLPTVMADRSQLSQLLSNLLDNAIRYRGNRPLSIQVECLQRQNDWLFSVRDNGRGFDPKHTKHAFHVFQRLQLDDEHDGSGMGLAVCKRIVEIHGGQMWVESEPDTGSCFYFTFPLSSQSERDHAAGRINVDHR